MSVTVDDIKPLDIDARSFEPIALKEVTLTTARIKENLDRGLNADGGSLRSYSKSYEAFLEAEGENTTVDLLRKGDLRRSMQTQNIPGGAQIYFMGGHYGGMSAAGLAQTLEEKGFTDWFGLGDQDMDRIIVAVEDWLDSQFKNS